MLTDEERLIQKIQSIERLFAGATTDGERIAASNALKRIRKRLDEIRKFDLPVEYKFTLNDLWSRRLLVSLMRRYGLKPYRYHGQRYTTVMAVVPKSFVDDILWPEFLKLDDILKSYLEKVTNRIISECIFTDNSEAEIRNEVNTPLPERFSKRDKFFD